MSKRRRFQAPLTHFFSSRPSDTSEVRNSEFYQHDRVSPSCSIPSYASTLQPSLLTVGMRVRKSVPEGYKTHSSRPKTYASPVQASFLWESETCHAPQLGSSGDTQPHSTAGSLVPYCGLHKVGGLAVQTFPSVVETAVPAITRADDEPDWSQRPTSSSQLFPADPNTNTRKWAQAFDLDEFDEFDNNSKQASCTSGTPFPLVQSSPTAYPYSHTCMPDLTAVSSLPTTMRPIAQPASRTRKKAGIEGKLGSGVGQENIFSVSNYEEKKGDSHYDFEEAAFLRPIEDAKMDDF